MDAHVTFEAISGSISGDTHYYTLSPPFFFAKENKIDLDFNEVVKSNHVTVAYDVLPTLKQEANTNQAHKLLNNDDARIGPINGKFLKHFYA